MYSWIYIFFKCNDFAYIKWNDIQFCITVIATKKSFLYFSTLHEYSSSHGQSVFGWKVKLVWNRWYTLRVYIRRTVTDCKNSRNRWTETIEVRFFHSPSSSFFTLPISLSDHADKPRFSFHCKKVKSDCYLSP